jgi:hypothetical protein
MLSQVLRFTFPSGSTISSAAFAKLRQSIASAGATTQYYGYTVPTRILSLPRKRHEVCWVIRKYFRITAKNNDIYLICATIRMARRFG